MMLNHVALIGGTYLVRQGLALLKCQCLKSSMFGSLMVIKLM